VHGPFVVLERVHSSAMSAAHSGFLSEWHPTASHGAHSVLTHALLTCQMPPLWHFSPSRQSVVVANVGSSIVRGMSVAGDTAPGPTWLPPSCRATATAAAHEPQPPTPALPSAAGPCSPSVVRIHTFATSSALSSVLAEPLGTPKSEYVVRSAQFFA
jgi:hypothetical protein